MHGDVEPRLRQRQRDGAANPLRAAGDQGGARDAGGMAGGMPGVAAESFGMPCRHPLLRRLRE